jgi:hypothetical protein
MKKAKNVTILIFALIGILSTIIYAYQFFKSQNDAKDYQKNCVLVKIGMPVSEAKKIMGDYDWFKKTTRSEIWIEDSKVDSLRQFYLSYPATFGGSDWPMIYFDPNTMLVTKIRCVK